MASVALSASRPPQTIQETMDRQIDPAADALWASVGTIETRQGVEHRSPRTAAQWATARENAEAVIAGARNLQTPRLPVGSNGHGLLADAATPGIRTAAQIRTDIDRDPRRFVKAAQRLEHGGELALAAINARDADRLIVAGAAIDAACEACHSAYWYPRSPPLRLLPPDQFGKIAHRP